MNGLETAVDIRLCDELVGEQSISNCPYKLGKLIEDQGLDCWFGRWDYCFLSEIRSRSYGLKEEIEALSDELGRFLPSGRQSWV
jgi:hypothetical protein